MADNKDIEIKIKADTSDIETGLKDVEKASTKMAKKIEKSGDRAEKSFNDMEKTLKNTKKQMEGLTRNVNFNGLVNSMKQALGQISQQVNNTTKQFRNQLNEALNTKASVELDVKTNASGSGSGGGLLGSLAIGGATTNAVKDMKQTTQQTMQEVGKTFNSGIRDMKSEADTLGMIFDGIKGNVVSKFKEIRQQVIPIIESINQAWEEEFAGEDIVAEKFDLYSFLGNMAVAQKEADSFLKEMEKGLTTEKKSVHDLAKTINDLTFNMSSAGAELEKITRPTRVNTGNDILNPEQFEKVRQLIQQTEKDIDSLATSVFQLNFVENLDLSNIINSLDKFEQSQTKLNAQPLIKELQKLQREADVLGLHFKNVDDVLLYYAQHEANATELTSGFKNALIATCQQFRDYNSQVLTNVKAQKLLAQRQREIASQQTEFGKALVKSKHVLQDFSNGVKQAFSKSTSHINKMKQSVKDWANKHKQATNTVKKANSSLTSSFKGLVKSMMPFLTLYGAFNLIKSSVTGAMDAMEGNNMYMSVFGDKAQEMDRWIQSVNKSMGLGVNNTKQYTAIIQQMGLAMNLTTDEAMNMSKKMATMAGDISSFYNIDLSQTQEDLRSALSGSNEVKVIA